MSLKVRTSNSLDIPALYDLAVEYCLEIGQEFDTEAVFKSIQLWLRDCLVAELDGEVVGVIAYTSARDPWTGALHSWCSHWFVTKEHRGRTGLELLKAAKPDFINLPPNAKCPKGYKAKAIIYEKT